MKYIWRCRRTYICTLSIACLTALGLIKGLDVASSLAAVAIGLAGSNAVEGFMTKKSEKVP